MLASPPRKQQGRRGHGVHSKLRAAARKKKRQRRGSKPMDSSRAHRQLVLPFGVTAVGVPATAAVDAYASNYTGQGAAAAAAAGQGVQVTTAPTCANSSSSSSSSNGGSRIAACGGAGGGAGVAACSPLGSQESSDNDATCSLECPRTPTAQSTTASRFLAATSPIKSAAARRGIKRSASTSGVRDSDSGSGSDRDGNSGGSSSSRVQAAKATVRRPLCADTDSDASEHDTECYVCGYHGLLVVCEGPQCPRAAHMACLGLDKLPEGDFLCAKCMPDVPEGLKFAETVCQQCNDGRDDDQMLLCDKCDGGYHMYCLRPVLVSVPAGDWLCPKCRPIAPADDSEKKFIEAKKKIMSAPQLSIMNFFKQTKLKGTGVDPQVAQGKRRRRKGRAKVSCNTLLLPKPAADVQTRTEQLASLIAALAAKGIEFTDEQVFPSPSCPPSANDASLEDGKIQVMTKKNTETFKEFKARCAKGLYPPVRVVSDPEQGFYVIADGRIPRSTLLCEYVGEVHTLASKLHDEDDSMMELLATGDPTTSLVITPRQRGNIARYLNGINNSTAAGRLAQNVKSARYNVEGKARVILYAGRDIRKGERLCYDYNGHRSSYPTAHFV